MRLTRAVEGKDVRIKGCVCVSADVSLISRARIQFSAVVYSLSQY